ncbi:MAG: NADH-quinone oxidoreductase subunit J [Marinifilaceae bacterium]|nr:NADH-quinone oxidoreductase subunit J [Marinifilaceae bacterium]
MNSAPQEAVFYILSAAIVIFSVMTVTTRRILRSATYLLFVLFATAGLYFQLNYSFLGAVQLVIYAGGIIILYVFSILLTTTDKDKVARLKNSKILAGVLTVLAGAALCVFITITHNFGPTRYVGDEVPMKVIGTALMGTEKYQYLLPFEAISLLLLACIIGGIIIARKR